jgi:glycogen phosphorylase
MTVPSRPLQAAYFSMEIALEAALPTYAGGLGVLAGDTLRSAADMGLPMVGMTLLYRKGYFEQHLDSQGNQSETPSGWDPMNKLQPLEPRVSLVLDGQEIAIRSWQYTIESFTGHRVPVYLLDTALPENSPFAQTLTDELYGGDQHYRLCQEAILGIGGLAMLRRLGHRHLLTFHMNEGHPALLALALLEEHLAGRSVADVSMHDLEFVRKKCVFTTHTPVPAGHDQFSLDMVQGVLGTDRSAALQKTGCLARNILNMTELGLRYSHYINGVAMQHGEISRGLFPDYSIRAITNGVHAVTWTSSSFQELFDRHIPEWRRDNLYLRYAIGISQDEIREAHLRAKQALLSEVERATGKRLDANVMTLGFARRATAYKRADLFFSDLDRLRTIARNVGPFQIIYGGKAHPQDQAGKEQIRRVFHAMEQLKDSIKAVYVENYDMRWATLMTSGVDLWINTPQRPYEASGTSGMKAALNGVPSFSVPDGWWLEGHVEGATGWDIGREEIPETAADELESLYHKFETIIVPMFYGRPDAYAEVMRHSIALNGSFFNAQRMLAQYVSDAYFDGKQAAPVEQLIANTRQSTVA